MELARKFEVELSNLDQAVGTFSKAVNLEQQGIFDDLTADLIKNGKIQKFEYCSELCWKVSKMFLELRTGEIEVSPKQVYKKMFVTKLIDKDLFEAIFKTIDDRNKLSHIYKEEMYDVVYSNLPQHLNAFARLLQIFLDSNRPGSEYEILTT